MRRPRRNIIPIGVTLSARKQPPRRGKARTHAAALLAWRLLVRYMMRKQKATNGSARLRPVERNAMPACSIAQRLPVVAMLAALPALAGAVQAAKTLSPVVVSATRTAQDPFDIAASVNVVAVPASGNLDVNPSELLAGIPGILARDRQNYAQDEQISIRGFGARSTFGIRGVRLYTDGIPATMPDGQGQVSHFNLDSADRIEVLRGPFSALYGNASGGVVQLFTADGSNPPQLRFGVAGGSDGLLRAETNARGVAGPFDYNVDFAHFQTDGYHDHSRAQRESGNAKLGWQLDAHRKLTLVLNTLNVPGAQDPQGLTPAQYRADPRQSATPSVPYDTRKSVSQQQGGLVYEDQLTADGSLRLMGYYGERRVQQFLSVPRFAQASPLSSGGVVSLDNAYGGADARWTWAGELAGRPFQLALGLNYDNQHQHRRGYQNFLGDRLGVVGALRRDEEDRVYDNDEYAQASWRVSEDWTLMAGVRHNRVNFISKDNYITASNPDDSGRVHYTATTPVAGVLFRLSPRAHLYADWGKGFETPTFSELGYRYDGLSGLALYLQPARTRSGEVGIKLEPTAQSHAELALFRADSRHELAVATNLGGRTTYQNIDSARRQGIEASFDARLGARWKASFAYTWLDAIFRSPFLTCVSSSCATPDTPGGRRHADPRRAALERLRRAPLRGRRRAGSSTSTAASRRR
jgi:Outer membrane receptor for Fe3+-dicitrate